MAKVDSPDIPAFYMNPSAYAQVKGDNKKARGREIRRTDGKDFSRVLEDIRGKTADEIGPLRDLPVSEETVNLLMDEVRDAGDALRDRPSPDEIIRYKQAVRNFMYYVVENGFSLERESGIPIFLKPGYRGPRGTPEAMKSTRYTKIQVIDKKLEDLAAMLLSSQRQQLNLAARLEEIQGLLVDLLQ
ncbi:MAG: YaaR family protein [Treponema sp.]|jgi:uncharacterized protein YaaR (DUF327 family)|nr:YaaR family protein [Treponema sp.]